MSVSPVNGTNGTNGKDHRDELAVELEVFVAKETETLRYRLLQADESAEQGRMDDAERWIRDALAACYAIRAERWRVKDELALVVL